MNQSTTLQTQIVSHALNKMEEIMLQTIREKSTNFVQYMKSKCYEVEQMHDEYRRMWLLCLCDRLKRLHTVGRNMGFKFDSDYTFNPDLSYSRQIYLVSSLIYTRVEMFTQRVQCLNGKWMKFWSDLLTEMPNGMNKWTQEYISDDLPYQPESESDSETESDSDSPCDCN
jgi:hypothetical protein